MSHRPFPVIVTAEMNPLISPAIRELIRLANLRRNDDRLRDAR